MEATELMIGDYLQVEPSGMAIRINAIREKMVGYHSCEGRTLFVLEEIVHPIPLTPEILKKNGFNVVDENELRVEYAWHDNNSYTSISVTFYKTPICGVNVLFRCERNFSGGCDKIHNCHIDFVHELQHALHLCGIEKEIEL